MGGYFIINGIERIVRMLIMQRQNYVCIVRLLRDTPLKINPRIFLAGLKVYIIVTYLSRIARL